MYTASNKQKGEGRRAIWRKGVRWGGGGVAALSSLSISSLSFDFEGGGGGLRHTKDSEKSTSNTHSSSLTCGGPTNVCFSDHLRHFDSVGSCVIILFCLLMCLTEIDFSSQSCR